ncbi:MAG: zinc ribbon domain-containing protein [Planctomycetes bacterium]|nr:zinc ribbon domain-containing protein [Planctomycetota bacterium]
MGMPGPLELMIILGMGMVFVVVPIAALVLVLLFARRSSRSQPDSPPCSNCGGHVVPGAQFCHQCGSPLQQ